MSLPATFVPSDIMAHSSDGSIRAHADVDAFRLMGLDAEVALSLWDAQACPKAWLPVCAYNYSVTLFESVWSEQTLRDWIDGNWNFIRQIGTPPAFATALAPSGYRVADMVRPPQGLYAVSTQTKEEQDAWIKLMPEIRITFGARVGGPDFHMFVGDFIEPGDCDYGFIGPNDGPVLVGRFGVLRRDGVDTPLAVAVETKTYTPGQRVYDVSYATEGLSELAIFVGDSFVNDPERYIGATQLEPEYINALVAEDYIDENSVFALDFITPGLAPLSSRWGLESDVGDAGAGTFVGDTIIGLDFVTANDAPYLIAQVLRLLDPTVVAAVNSFGSYINDRISIGLRTMEILVDLEGVANPSDTFVGNGFIGEIFALETDREPFERAFRAIEAARGLDDTVMVSFEDMRSLEVHDAITEDTTVGAWVPNSL